METFLESNPGFQSRFPRTIHFPDYTPDELLQIFERFCDESDYLLPPAAAARVREVLAQQQLAQDRRYGNGRAARNLFEDTVGRLARRVTASQDWSIDSLTIIVPEDVPENVRPVGSR